MQHAIEDSLLSPADRQILARLLAVQSAAINDRAEEEIQANLRALADSRPAPDDRLRAAVEADKTPYVPGVRGKRRTVAVLPTASTSEPPKTEAKPINEPLPFQPEVKKNFFARLLAWLEDCPIRTMVERRAKPAGVTHHPFGLD